MRQGDDFTGYYSTDGVNWTPIAGALTLPMPNTILAGLAVTAHNNGDLNNSTFTNVSLLPAGWSDGDIGGPTLPGGAISDGDSWTISGGGSDIYFASDQFNYASETLQGDGAMVARVTSLTPTDPWAKAGVMFRASNDPSSAFVDAVVTPGNGVAFQWRDQDGNLGSEQVYALSAPAWVELVRRGDEFTGYYSTDGVDWTPIAPALNLDLPSTVLAGLAVTAHNDGLLAGATFADVSLVLPFHLTGLSTPSPSIRNKPVPSVEITFDRLVDPSSLVSAVTLTLDGSPVKIAAGTLSATLVPGTTSTYLLSGLTGLTRKQGRYQLTLNATLVDDPDNVAGLGSLAVSWLMDTTAPVSKVRPLAAVQKSLDFVVSVEGGDPSPARGVPVSGVAYYDIYVSANNSRFVLWTRVSAKSPSAIFHGLSNTTYAFYSVAYDLAGNVQETRRQVQARTHTPTVKSPIVRLGASAPAGEATGLTKALVAGNAAGGPGPESLAVTSNGNASRSSMLDGIAGPPDSRTGPSLPRISTTPGGILSLGPMTSPRPITGEPKALDHAIETEFGAGATVARGIEGGGTPSSVADDEYHDLAIDLAGEGAYQPHDFDRLTGDVNRGMTVGGPDLAAIREGFNRVFIPIAVSGDGTMNAFDDTPASQSSKAHRKQPPGPRPD